MLRAADKVTTKPKVGNGGDGVALPYWEKHAVVGGFDGGDGGKGGSAAPSFDDGSNISLDPCH